MRLVLPIFLTPTMRSSRIFQRPSNMITTSIIRPMSKRLTNSLKAALRLRPLEPIMKDSHGGTFPLQRCRAALQSLRILAFDEAEGRRPDSS